MTRLWLLLWLRLWLLLWPILLLAQDPAVDNQMRMNELPYPIVETPPVLRFRPKQDTLCFDRWLVRRWREYKAECYADSTRKISGYELRDIGYVISAVDTLYTEWLHKRPTAEGFMRWLEERTEK